MKPIVQDDALLVLVFLLASNQVLPYPHSDHEEQNPCQNPNQDPHRHQGPRITLVHVGTLTCLLVTAAALAVSVIDAGLVDIAGESPCALASAQI